jgi:Caspase domain
MNRHSTIRTFLLSAPVAALLLALQAFSPLWAQCNASRTGEADKLHVVLLVAGHDGGIGNADLKDIAAMKHTMDAAFANDNGRVVYHDLTGINDDTGNVYTAAEILAYLRGMEIGKNDNVLVFHSGHGAITDRDRPEDSHVLLVDGGKLARKDIRDILSAKSPRSLMILTDCCSAFVGGPAGFAGGRGLVAGPAVNVATVRNLLLKASGIVSITAAEDGTNAIANFTGDNPGQAGSAFTVALTRLWYRVDVTFTSWEQMFPELRAETHLASGGVHQARAFEISTNAVVPAMQPATQDMVQQRFRS